MLRAGIIGCGGITERRHGPVLAGMKDRVEIAALADLAEERTGLMGEKLGVGAEHENGATTSLQVGWSAPVGGIGVNEILGTEGQIRFGGGEAPVSVWSKDTGEWAQPPVDREGPDELGFPPVVRQFVDAIENDGEEPVSGEEARHILAIILAAYESGRTGKPVEVG